MRQLMAAMKMNNNPHAPYAFEDEALTHSLTLSAQKQMNNEQHRHQQLRANGVRVECDGYSLCARLRASVALMNIDMWVIDLANVGCRSIQLLLLLPK